jgi:hypothetical protein
MSRNTQTKHGINNSDNALLSMVNIRYDVTAEPDSDQTQVQTLDPPQKLTDMENNGTIKPAVDAAITPPPHGATHRFFEKRAKKKSNPDPLAQGPDVKSERTKKRKSLQDIRRVPVEVMRERAALQAKLNEQRSLERQSSLAESDLQTDIGK